MANLADPCRDLLEAIEEPSLIVHHDRVLAANRAARSILGHTIVGGDVRFAIRHPLALDTIANARSADIDVIGIGSADRAWTMTVRMMENGAALVRLGDRSHLAASERMRTDFVANASHELRTPLATIIGYAETLGEQGPLEEALRTQFGGTISGEARRMLRIIEDLMSLSRIEADRFLAPSEPVDLGEIARIAVDNAAPLAERRGCAIVMDIDDRPPVVPGDFAQIMQLADNLVGNAIRYGCSQGTQPIEIAVRTEGARAVLIVRDHGEGIAADHLPRLTERFYRVDAARSRDSGGTGLGLAIVKHIVERHRGTIDIRSTVGRGTVVTVALPLS